MRETSVQRNQTLPVETDMWVPISRSEFESLYQEQLRELSKAELAAFEKYQVPITECQLCRSAEMGYESVFVVARTENGVLYFDDVEHGFNVAFVDASDRILKPGGSQYRLSEAVQTWLMPNSQR